MVVKKILVDLRFLTVLFEDLPHTSTPSLYHEGLGLQILSWPSKVSAY